MHARRTGRRQAPYLRRASASLTLALALAATLGGCGGDSTGPGEGASQVTVSGTLTGPKVAELPEGAHLVVLWVVSAGTPDYEYVFGDGTIDRATGRFTLTLPERPPEDALNKSGSYALGVGTIFVLSPEATLAPGRLAAGNLKVSDILGAAGQHAVLYTEGNPASAPVAWARAFPRGYATGHGIAIPGTFDGFEAVDPTAFQVIVDDLVNIPFVEWT